ncbi:MAG: 1-acyl-sn-glycerol-3-phosphate acyltransferase [Sphingomonas sp.]|nr:1-acyl-sn-glycerol-3-phosphate acyltransferase [Sphingomonas sp.]
MLLLLFAVVGPTHVATKILFGKSRWPPWFLAASARIVGARTKVVGLPLKPGTLLISNHVSWLDILVLGGSTGTAFVSKDNLGHGVIHWLADQNATLYVSREDRKGSKDQAISIARAAERDQPITLFPEGTTGPGDEMLPFRSSLLEAATYASAKVEVRPLALDYGEAARELGWHGESGTDNVLRILGRKGPLPVTVHLLPPLDRTSDRKALAQAAREAIAETLASSRGSAPLYPDHK